MKNAVGLGKGRAMIHASDGPVDEPASSRPPRGRRADLARLIESPAVTIGVSAVIVLNAIVLGLETSSGLSSEARATLQMIDDLCLAFFVVELLVRAYAFGGGFLRDPWSVFDAVVVSVALVPSTGPLSVLRTLRVLRVLRLLSVAPTMRRVVNGLLAAVPGLMSIMGIMAIIFYVSAVIATGLYGATFPEWFGSLGRSAYTLFQVMTLESWSMGIVRPIMNEHPLAWVFFIPFILIATFTLLNLFIAVIVNAVQKVQQETLAVQRAAADDQRQQILSELSQIEASLEKLRRGLDG